MVLCERERKIPVNLFQLLKISLSNPKKQAAARILPIGKIMQFVFAIILVLTLISYFNLLTGLSTTASDLDGLLEYVEKIQWLLYPFAFLALFVSTTAVHFVKISFFALIGMAILLIKKKKGEYRHLWRTAALAVTGPTFLSVILSYFGAGLFGSLLSAILTSFFLWAAVRFYPNLPQTSPKAH